MKSIIYSILVAIMLIGGAFLIAGKGGDNAGFGGENVSIVDGKQIIVINAKGGYQPRKSIAKAGLPTVIRFDTKGTFDCSLSVRIPSMKISKLLPQTGSTDIDIGSSKAGTLNGSCGMGMYPFEINFLD
jgi:plastocyanin domain-containing protein